jgi:hypothetical protein
MTVVGVDSARGPYREDVSTSTISCHGCKYDSKYEVLDNSVVVVELTPEDGAEPVTTRGRVKFARRPNQTGGLFQTAIEFDQPSNLWHLEVSPTDWLPFNGRPVVSDINVSKSKPFAVPRPELVEAEAKRVTPEAPKPNGHAATTTKAAIAASTAASIPAAPVPAGARPVGHVMNEFQEQMEKMLSEAATAAVRERAGSTLAEARSMLQEEAKNAIAAAAASESKVWIEQSVQQMKAASYDAGRSIQEEWNRKLQRAVDGAIERVEEQRQEMSAAVDDLTAKAIEQLQTAIESTRRDGMDRIISRLKEQLSPVLASTHQAAAHLTQLREETRQVSEQFLEQSNSQMEESYERLRQQFEKFLQKRLETARDEMEKLGQAAANVCAENLRSITVEQQSDTREELRKSFAPLAESVLSQLRERAEETSQLFSEELAERSKSHLEFVGSTISEAARGLAKAAKK